MHTAIAQRLERTQLVTRTEVTTLESEPDTIAVVHYKLSVYKDTQTSRQKAVEEHDNEELQYKPNDEFQLSAEYAGYCKQFLDTLTEFQPHATDTKDRRILENTTPSYSLRILTQFTLHHTGRDQKLEILKRQRVTKFCRKKSFNVPKQNGPLR